MFCWLRMQMACANEHLAIKKTPCAFFAKITLCMYLLCDVIVSLYERLYFCTYIFVVLLLKYFLSVIVCWENPFPTLQLSCVKMWIKMCAVDLTNDNPSKRHQIMKVIKMFRSCFWVLVELKLIIHDLYKKYNNLICYFIRCAFFFRCKYVLNGWTFISLSLSSPCSLAP